MDDTLKRRLIGAGLLLFAAFLLASMLPEPGLRPVHDRDTRVVTIPLQGDDQIATSADPVVDTPVPTAIAAADADGALQSTGGDAPPEIVAGDAPVEPAATPASIATPAPTSAPTASPRPTPAATPTAVPAAPGAGRWWVQIGSYSNIDNARQVEARMRALGEPVVVAPIEAAGGILYRVRCGPYADEAIGAKAHGRIVGDGYADARLINP